MPASGVADIRPRRDGGMRRDCRRGSIRPATGADDLLSHAADLDQRIEIDAGIDAHLLAQQHQLFGADVAGARARLQRGLLTAGCRPAVDDATETDPCATAR